MSATYLFGFNIFLSAFLIFFIQPMSAKFLLPQYGGSAFVWIACLLFFQMSLFIGYAYAYLLDRFLKIRNQVLTHVILIALAFYFMPLDIPAPSPAVSSPLAQIVYSLIASLLIPLTLVSSTSPLLQHWYCYCTKSEYPYRFYAISNAGSLIGLLGYPLYLEMWFPVDVQFLIWSSLFLLFAALSLGCSWCAFSKRKPSVQESKASLPKPTFWQISSWVLLPFISSALLVATTFYISQNLINMPLIWVLPLALFLISFIITFSDFRRTDTSFWNQLYIVWVALFSWLIFKNLFNGIDIILVLLALMYSAMMVCHAKLYQLRPPTKDLTLFYLMIAFGGMMGGLFVNLATWLQIKYWWDLYLPVLGVAVLSAIFAYHRYQAKPTKWTFSPCIIALLTLPMFSLTVLNNLKTSSKEEIYRHRNPYGIVTVLEKEIDTLQNYRQLRHGSIIHGLQFINPPMDTWPTSYYGYQSGVGGAISYLHTKQPSISVGAIGLGAGTIATLTKEKDTISFYEIDRDIIEVSSQYFSYLTNAKADIKIHLGDGRVNLQQLSDKEQKPIFDLIVVDAFSGDSIPFHLITKESFDLYQTLLKPNGIIAFHISNMYMDLTHITKGLVENSEIKHLLVTNQSDHQKGVFLSEWVLLTTDPSMRHWLKHAHYKIQPDHLIKPILWTDGSNSLIPILRLTSLQ